ncbi:MAG: hypothetical protein KGL48_04020 [Sphingomonadales bacterium]|nr:hypothetical protein [Sphingomonadales bacterium]MDE2570457.1 hypothetical protein [Sphingomonadales bacterium]
MRMITKLIAPALFAAMGLGFAIPAGAATPYHQVDRNAPAPRQVHARIDQQRGDRARAHARIEHRHEAARARHQARKHHRWEKRGEHRR